MTIKERSILSFYKEIAYLGQDRTIMLVQHTDTGRIYVKKILQQYNLELYRKLKEYQFPGIPQILECIQDDDKLIVIEEYIHGKTLEEVRQDYHGIVPEAEVLRYGIELCNILENLHSVHPQIIHRDIKPTNVMISADGAVKLIDFNAARTVNVGAVQDTMFVGTQTFAAPEQYGFGQSDQRTDIYGLGVTLNYLLTGEDPKKQIAGGKWEKIIKKCTEMNPKERFQSVVQLRNNLKLLQYSYAENHRRENDFSFDEMDCPDIKDGFPAMNTEALPGFRNNVWWKKVIATCVYLMMIWIAVTMEIEDPMGTIDVLASKIAVLFIEFGTGLWIFNYKDCRYLFPGMNRSRVLHCILSCAYWLLMATATVWIEVIVVALITA